MRRSKLESYECILRALAGRFLTIDSLAYETDMDVAILKRRLEFLTRNGLVEERNHQEKTYYGLTEKGAAVYRVFNLTTPLEKLAIAARALDEALQMLPTLSDYNGGRERKPRKNENY